MLRLSVVTLLSALPVIAVVPIPVGSLIYEEAHYFDLSSRRVRFKPTGPTSYRIATGPSRSLAVRHATPVKPRTAVSLPCAFPFGGRTWREVNVNLNGNLTFGEPEKPGDNVGTWPDRTLHWFATYLDARAVTGVSRMIAPLWGFNSSAETRIATATTARELVVTWDAVRLYAPDNGYPPLGHSVFQVRLSRDGAIEFRYGAVAEKDGIAGIFPGLASATRLDAAGLAPTASVELDDAGTQLRFTIHTKVPVPVAIAVGKVSYHVYAASGDALYRVGLTIDANGRTDEIFCGQINSDHTAFYDQCLVSPAVVTDGSTISVYVPKSGLREPGMIHWQAEVVFDDATVSTGEDYREAHPHPTGLHFATPPGTASGAVYEIFHYPYIPKSPQRILKTIYSKLPGEEDFAIIVTDFRMDDVHNQTASVGAGSNGNDFTFSPDEQLATFGSRHLQLAVVPWYLGPQCQESPLDPPRVWKNYPFCVGTMAHELGHRWAARAEWRGPVPDPLHDDGRHWSIFLNTSVVYPVSALFSDTPYPEESVMGGTSIQMSPDGKSGSTQPTLWQAPTGFSALDLYLMGMIGASEVPDTILISGAKRTPAGGYGGGDAIPVRIADIIAAGGERTPPAAVAQRRFTLRTYLLHEDGRRPDPEKLKMAQGAEAILVRYFSVATGGRMTLVPE